MKNVLTVYATILSVLTVVIIGISTYNNLQRSEEHVFNTWGDLDASLQRRADLIPNLVTTAKSYMETDSKPLDSVAEARVKVAATHIDLHQLANPAQMRKFIAAQQELQQSLARLLVVVEQYPSLKTNQNFIDIQNQLELTEGRIDFTRQQANAAIRDFNYAIRKFPASIINHVFLHLKRKEFFKAEANVEQVYSVEFSDN